MKKPTWWVVGVIVVVIIIVAISGSTKKSDTRPSDTRQIKIGFTGPLSGEMANYGENARAAVQIAVDEVNSSGGVNGRPIEVLYENDKCAGPEGVSAMTKLINVDKVIVAVAGLCSPAVLSFAPLNETAKVPFISYCATAPKITESGDYTFRDVPSDLFQATFGAKYIYNTLGKRKAAVVYVNNDWGLGLRGAFTDAFKQLGGEIVADESYLSASKDLRTQLAKVKSSGADVLYFAGFPDGTIAGLKQAKELKLTQTIFGADAWDSNDMWQQIGQAGEGAMYTRVGTNSTDAFRAKMKEKLGNDNIIYCSNYAYDAIKILAQVISQVGTDSTAIKDALYKVSYTGGVSSKTIEFDQNGDPKGASYVINVVKNGKAEVVPQ